jgi:pilus assembly protein Flp/PilA
LARYVLTSLAKPGTSGKLLYLEEIEMKETLLKLSAKLREEVGQDLIEYALVVALIAFAATVGMKAVATGINTAFTNIGTALTTDTGNIAP